MDISEHARLNALLYQFGQTYLEKRGWFESLDGVPRNKQGLVPYITYPAYRQIERVLKPTSRVFEFGSGASSHWWAAHAAEVFSVEHDADWARRVSETAPANLTVVTRVMGEDCSEERRAVVAPFFADPPDLPVSPLEAHNIMHGLLCDAFVAYATEIAAFEPASFDVILVDGMARALTAWLAIRYIKDDGIIVFDNSDRWQYNGAYRMLSAAGFRRIDYYGPGPINRNEWCTSLFVKDLNVFAASVDSPQGDCDLGW